MNDMDSKSLKLDSIEGNYLLSIRFLPFTILDIALAVVSTLGITLAWIQRPSSTWIYEISTMDAVILYVILAFLGFSVGVYLLRRFEKKFIKKEAVRVSIPYMILVLSPPFSVVSVVLGFAVNTALGGFGGLAWSYLFYGPGLGLLLARFLYFIHRSRLWTFRPIPNEEPEAFPNVKQYIVSKR